MTVSWAGSVTVRLRFRADVLAAASQSFATLVGDFRTATIVMNHPRGASAPEMCLLRLAEYPDLLMQGQIMEPECR